MKVRAKNNASPCRETENWGPNPYASNFAKWGITNPVRESFPEHYLALKIHSYSNCHKVAKFTPKDPVDFHFKSANPINVGQDMVFKLVAFEGYFPNKTLHVSFFQ